MALKDMYDFREAVNKSNDDKTKANDEIPAVSAISYSNLSCMQTRSDDTAEAGIYIVNFEDEQGFSLLNATYKGSPIFALTEKGHFEKEKFERAYFDLIDHTITDVFIEDSLCKDSPDYIYNLLAESVYYNFTQDNPQLTKTSFDDNPYIQILSSVTPLTATKWGQEYPFNQCMPQYSLDTSNPLRGRVPVGCAVIAAAQMMEYINYPQFSSIVNNGGDWIMFGGISNYGNYTDYYPYTFDTNVYLYGQSIMLLLAEGLYELSEDFNAQYSMNGTGVATISVLNALQTLDPQHFSTAEITNLPGNISTLVSMLDNYSPAYTRGNDSLTGTGHAWLTDGYAQVQFTGQNTSEYYFHFNWGWMGQNDGYYSLNSFAVYDRLGYEPVIDNGSNNYSSYNFNNNVQFIKYTHQL